QRKKVCSVRLCFLHRALIDMAPTSASRRMPMICSSVNRFFMELSLPVKGRELTSQMATRSVSGHVDITVDHGISGAYVVRVLDQAAWFRGYPRAVRTDNGPEFTSRAFIAWTQQHGIAH